ncbi:MAG TPA: Hsp70 family protein [Amycolatopsis sp.]|nr:Hsp70 family protein [Amycolatopsis sp.]
MRYVLGIDIGSTRIKAAVCRRAGEFWGEPDVVLRPIDSVLHVAADGTVLVGPEARRHVAFEPHRIARGFARRVGDDVPIVLGDELYLPESLTAVAAGWIADQVGQVEGGEPGRVALTHPPGWGPYRRRLLLDALDEAGLPGALLLPAPIAAAESQLTRERIETGTTLAVCRLGGEHLDIAVLRRGPHTFELLAHAEQPAPDLDGLLADRVEGNLTHAKELLSTGDTGPLTRAEFERLAHPVLTAALQQLTRYEHLDAVLLAGGQARIPVVEQVAVSLVSCRVMTDPDAGTAAARGAALAARPAAEASPESTALVPRITGYPELDPDEVYDAEPAPPRPPVVLTPLEPPRRRFVPARRSRNEDNE